LGKRAVTGSRHHGGANPQLVSGDRRSMADAGVDDRVGQAGQVAEFRPEPLVGDNPPISSWRSLGIEKAKFGELALLRVAQDQLLGAAWQGVAVAAPSRRQRR
jgi:hypothetical protein